MVNVWGNDNFRIELFGDIANFSLDNIVCFYKTQSEDNEELLNKENSNLLEKLAKSYEKGKITDYVKISWNKYSEYPTIKTQPNQYIFGFDIHGNKIDIDGGLFDQRISDIYVLMADHKGPDHDKNEFISNISHNNQPYLRICIKKHYQQKELIDKGKRSISELKNTTEYLILLNSDKK